MLKVCIIGGSGHYRYATDSMDDRVQLVGVAAGSVDEDMSQLTKHLSLRELAPALYDDWKMMLDKQRPDVVVVNSHYGDHANINIECLQRDIHTLSEKPVATKLDDLAVLKTVHTLGKSKFSAMFGTRYLPWFLTAHDAIERGRIGKVRLMQGQKSYKFGKRPAFYSNRASYGGTIPWVGSHAIDWLYWLSGEKFKSVYATHSRQDNLDSGELEMTALCQFTFSQEVFGSASMDYFRPATATSHDDDRIRIVGTKGVLEVSEKQVWLINEEAPGKQELPLLPERSIFGEFVSAALGTGDCMVSAEDAFQITQASLLARQSADEGRIVMF